MSEEKKNIANAKTVVVNSTTENENESLILDFHKPYHFEGQTFNSVDLTPLENVTGAIMTEASREAIKSGVVALQEMSLSYAQIIAAKVTNLPIEFFTSLDAKDSMKLKNIVSNFLYAED